MMNFRVFVAGAVASSLMAACGPTAGETCTSGTGACDDAQTFLACGDSGRFVRIPCRGPKACTTVGSSVQCDQSIGVEGDPCFATTGSGACAVGGRAQLTCKNGVFTKAGECVTCDVTATNQVNCTAPCGPGTCAGCCVNGTCQAGVANSACGKAGAACATCGAGETCSAEQRCAIDPNSMWRIQPSMFNVRTTDSTGAAWDVGGGAPDPYASLACPPTNMTRSATATANDTFMGTWTTGSCVMKASDLLSVGFSIGVFDEDVADDDVIAPASTIRPTEESLRAGNMSLTNNTTLTGLLVTFARQ